MFDLTAPGTILMTLIPKGLSSNLIVVDKRQLETKDTEEKNI